MGNLRLLLLARGLDYSDIYCLPGGRILIQEQLGGAQQVLTLGQSLYIVGNALGPVVLGPLSDIGGRKWVYVGAIFAFALINIVCGRGYHLCSSADVYTRTGMCPRS